MVKGILLTICAPSGTGKSTLINMLIKEQPQFGFSVSYTTRPPRPREVHGKDYFFVDQQEFSLLREKDFFAEWAKVHDNYYGTPKKEILKALQAGKSLIFDIDVQGAAQLKKNLDTGVFVFIFPPSLKALEKRLLKRGTDDPRTIRTRMRNAEREISQSGFFDFWIVNDNLETAFSDLKSIIRAEKLRPSYSENLPQSVLKGDS
jgi:guanylate kinase